MKKILFTNKTPVAYRGRNGWGKMSGIEIHSVPAGYVSINPVTSKGAASDAAILEIPDGDTISVCAGILDVDRQALWAAYCMLKSVIVNHDGKYRTEQCQVLDISASGTATVIFNDDTKDLVWIKHLAPL